MKKRIIIPSIILILAISSSIYFRIWQYIQPEIIKTYIEGFGVWIPVIYCLLYLIAVFIPHAGTAMTIVGGLLFTPAFGTALVITISSVGSIFPFLIAKKFGRERIKSKIEKTKYKKYLNRTDENSFMFILYMRLIPLIPYELQNYIAGLIDISVGKFILATFIGLLPGTFALIYLGNTLTDIQPSKLIILGLISLFALLLPLVLKKFTKAKEILQEN
ncbi:MAG: TVP38/TMEM64 family protein [Nanoarchaeota archaeon]|nr:TVP38/TMEM64 family protein [Nanoarchaeota archaeon]